METIYISSRQKALEDERRAMRVLLEDDPLMRRVCGGLVFTDPVYMAMYINRGHEATRPEPSAILIGEPCTECAGE